jgi:predicted permease
MRLLRRLWAMIRVRRLDADLEEELQFHRAMKEQELQRAGLSTEQARLAARAALGNVTRWREEARAIWIRPWLESVWQDAVYAIRSLRREPGFALVSITALGVAIGLNTSLFTVFAGLALRPMIGVNEPARVVTVTQASAIGRGGGAIGLSFPEFRFLADEARSFDGLVAHRGLSVNLESDQVGRSTPAYGVTADYFDVLGVRMEAGRGFAANEDRRESPARVAVLSHQLWRTRFGATVLVGREIRIDGVPHTVVGITPPEFTGPEGTANRVWLPLSSIPTLRPNDTFLASLLDRWQDCCVNVTGRLAKGTTRSEAAAELQALSGRFRASVGQDARQMLIGGTQFLQGRGAKSEALAVIGLLFTGITLLLLIACANVGNLLLARAAARLGEIGVRLSIGASRRRIVRQLLTEGLVLAGIAAALGVGLATWLPPFVLTEVANQPAPFDIGTDVLVLVFATALAVIACVACALAPALHATRVDVASALKNGTAAMRSRLPLRTVLLAVQVAVTVVLLTSAGLLLRGVAQARTLDLGFTMDEVGVVTIELPAFAYDNTRAAALLNELRTAVRDVGLQSFAFTTQEPLSNYHFQTGMRLSSEGEEMTRPVEFIEVTPGYFDVLGLRLMAGRDFQESDAGRPVAIVNETLARQYWPGQNPVGRSFIGGGRESLEIVGLVKDAYTSRLNGIEPVFFRPLGTRVWSEQFPRLLFRATQPAAWTAVAARISSVEARAVVNVPPLQDRFENWLSELDFAPMAASILGVLGLTLATIGMFGVFAYVVRQRTREIGIRMALGAHPGAITRLVLSGNSRAVTMGVAAGLAGAVAASQVHRSSLYGLSPLDPIAYGGVVLLLAAAATAASYLPARRATRVDPALALRHE